MGLSHSWIAVQGLDRTSALEQLALELGREAPTNALPNLGIAEAPGGWLILFMRGEAAFEPRFVALSRGRSAVAWFEEEHVMCSEARGYTDGVETWRVAHDAEKGPRHLAVTGAAPSSLAAIRASQEAEDNPDVDFIFEIPPEVAKSVCGWRFLDPDSPELVFHDTREQRSESGRPGFFARLLGRR